MKEAILMKCFYGQNVGCPQPAVLATHSFVRKLETPDECRAMASWFNAVADEWEADERAKK